MNENVPFRIPNWIFFHVAENKALHEEHSPSNEAGDLSKYARFRAQHVTDPCRQTSAYQPVPSHTTQDNAIFYVTYVSPSTGIKFVCCVWQGGEETLMRYDYVCTECEMFGNTENSKALGRYQKYKTSTFSFSTNFDIFSTVCAGLGRFELCPLCLSISYNSGKIGVGTASKEVPESTTAWQSKSRAKHLIRKFQMDMKSIQTYSNHVKSQLPGNGSRF